MANKNETLRLDMIVCSLLGALTVPPPDHCTLYTALLFAHTHRSKQ